MTFDSILPPSIAVDARFVTLEQLAARVQHLDISPVLTNMVDHVGVDVLPLLAEQFSLFGDGWELANTDTAKRELIKNAIEIHRHKGTPWAMKRTLAILGFDDGVIVENPTATPAKWYEYRIDFTRAITVAQGLLVRSVLLNIAPARCVLVGLDFTVSPYRYDGLHSHNAEISYGMA